MSFELVLSYLKKKKECEGRNPVLAQRQQEDLWGEGGERSTDLPVDTH